MFAGNGQGGSTDGKGVASFAGAYGIVMDKDGNLFASDYKNTLIRKIGPDGTVTTFAGNVTGVSSGHAASVDGTGTNASFMAPAGMAIDGAGNIYVADQLSIRMITPGGVVTTLPGSSYFKNSDFLQVTLDASGNIYASDAGNKVILKINTDGTSGIYATGGDLANSPFHGALGLVFDGSGNLFFADGDNSVRKISPAKTISLVAGIPMTSGFANGAGNQATFFNLVGIARDATGNLFVSDYGNRAIREILPDGSVSTVVVTPGANTPSGPSDMVFDAAGNLFLANGQSILKITLN